MTLIREYVVFIRDIIPANECEARVYSREACPTSFQLYRLFFFTNDLQIDRLFINTYKSLYNSIDYIILLQIFKSIDK